MEELIEERLRKKLLYQLQKAEKCYRELSEADVDVKDTRMTLNTYLRLLQERKMSGTDTIKEMIEDFNKVPSFDGFKEKADKLKYAIDLLIKSNKE